MMQRRVAGITAVRAHGTNRIPAAVEAIQTQPGDAGVLLTWYLPPRYRDVTGYRIYVGTEKNLAHEIKDRGTRQYFVPLEQRDNIFVSVVNGYREGPKKQVQGEPLQTFITPKPSDDFLEQFSGGLDKTQAGRPSGKKTP